MDGTPLDKAYSAAKNADAAVIAGDFSKAASLYDEAADYFDQVRTQLPNNKSVHTLKALMDQYKSRAQYFRSGKAASDLKKSSISPSNSTTVGTLGSVPPIAGSNRQPNRPNLMDYNVNSSQYNVLNTGSHSQLGISSPLSDSINSLVARSARVFARSFEQSINEKYPAAPESSPIDHTNTPLESFYLVKPQPSKSHRNIPPTGPKSTSGTNSGSNQITLSTLDRTQAIAQATKAQLDFLKTGIQHILNEAASKEQQINDEHTEEVDRLRAENDRLNIQVSKLKSRWEDLKESARKRQNNDQP